MLSLTEQVRYSRHLLLPQVGLRGQERLKASRALIVGAGGLGCPAALYLAAAGVGTILLADADLVDLTNLQRQVLHTTADVDRPKVASAAEALRALNPHITIVPIRDRITSNNALDLLAGCDLVLDGTDNLPTRYLLNDACGLLGIPLVYGGIYRFGGQVAVFDAGVGPCYRCLYPEPPPAHTVPGCAEGGVLGALAGVVGTWQALVALNLLLGIGDAPYGRLHLFDGLALRQREVRIPPNPDCPLCGTAPTITALQDYEALCGATTCAPSEWEIGHAAFLSLLGTESVTLLDVRQAWELESLSALPGARWLPEHEVPARLSELDPTATTVVYCTSGARSWHLAHLLRQAGFARVWSLRGGLLHRPPPDGESHAHTPD
jgi:adenylyltransferase/sulfurtransferase